MNKLLTVWFASVFLLQFVGQTVANSLKKSNATVNSTRWQSSQASFSTDGSATRNSEEGSPLTMPWSFIDGLEVCSDAGLHIDDLIHQQGCKKSFVLFTQKDNNGKPTRWWNLFHQSDKCKQYMVYAREKKTFGYKMQVVDDTLQIFGFNGSDCQNQTSLLQIDAKTKRGDLGFVKDGFFFQVYDASGQSKLFGQDWNKTTCESNGAGSLFQTNLAGSVRVIVAFVVVFLVNR